MRALRESNLREAFADYAAYCDRGQQAAADVIQYFGVEGDVRDAIGGTLYSGTSDIQRNIIASQLGVLR